jgi:zinc transport system permease protein
MALLALTIAVSLKIVGIILVSALVIVPAATARNVARDFRSLMGLSVAVGLISAVGGLVASFYLNTASGPTIVMLSIVLFIISLAAGRRRVL